MTEPLLLKIPEAAQLLNISIRHLRSLIAGGGIKTVRIGRNMFIERKVIDKLIAAGGVEWAK